MLKYVGRRFETSHQRFILHYFQSLTFFWLYFIQAYSFVSHFGVHKVKIMEKRTNKSVFYSVLFLVNLYSCITSIERC